MNTKLCLFHSLKKSEPVLSVTQVSGYWNGYMGTRSDH